MNLIFMLALNKTIFQLAMTNSVHWYGEEEGGWSCVGEGGWSCVGEGGRQCVDEGEDGNVLVKGRTAMCW